MEAGWAWGVGVRVESGWGTAALAQPHVAALTMPVSMRGHQAASSALTPTCSLQTGPKQYPRACPAQPA